jgi:hypothetical protein
MIRRYIFSFFIFSLLMLICSTLFAQDNVTEIQQVLGGDNVDINILQSGDDNFIDFSFDGVNAVIEIKQYGNNNEISFVDYWGSGELWGGDMDGDNNAIYLQQNCTYGSSCLKSDIGFHIYGDYTEIIWGQGIKLNDPTSESGCPPTCNYTPVFTNDADEAGGHLLNLDVHGNGNTLVGWQANSGDGSHTTTAYLYGDDNIGYIAQRGDVDKNLTIQTNNNDNYFWVQQRDGGNHTASITLDGTEPTDLMLNQTSSTNQTYSLSQYCVTSGGCAVSVTQGQ